MNFLKGLFKKRMTSFSITFQYDDDYMYFQLTGNEPYPVDAWLFNPPDNFDPLSENRRMVLCQMYEQGLVEYNGNQLQVAHQHLYELPSEDIEVLDLAEPYRLGLRITAKGTIHEPSFQYIYEYIDGSNRSIIGMKRVGCFLEYGTERRFLLSGSQFNLLVKLDEFNARGIEHKTYGENLLCFAEIKGLAGETAAQLDRYLNGEQVVVADEVAVNIKFIDDDTIQVVPMVEGVPVEAFSSVVDKFESIQQVYNLPLPNNNRLRIVTTEKARAGLREIKKIPRLRGRAKDHFIRRPQEFLDQEIVKINLEEFSDRVIDIVEYKPVYFPFINPHKNEWLPQEFTSRKKIDNEKDFVPLNSLAQVDALEAAYNNAMAKNESTFEWEGKTLPVNEETAVKIASLRQSFEEKHHYVAREAAPEYPQQDNTKKVFKILDNIEEAEYLKGTTEIPVIRRVPQLPNNLLPGTKLMEHQNQGLCWLQSLLEWKQSGGLLADDMGLGKTIQVLTFISWYLEQQSRKPVLIVAPVALLENWYEEYQKFFHMSFEILPLHGSRLSEMRIKREWSGREYDGEPRILLKTQEIEAHDIVLTTYETVRDYQFSLGKINWGIVVTDESQKIKNPTALVTTAVKALKTDFRIACTATPVENNLVDLWCIIDFTNPGRLGSLKDFVNKYEYPMRKAKEGRAELVHNLREEINPFFLRRLKKDILHNLPEKKEIPVTVPLSETQLDQYMGVVNAYRALDREKRRGAMLKVLQQLRDISSYPEVSEKALLDLRLENVLSNCTKVAKTLEILKDIKTRSEKAIIFTESRRVQRILGSVIHRKFGISPGIVNGEVSGSSKAGSKQPTRKKMVDEFQKKPGFNVIIMSPQAAGFGLNIVAANHVIHYNRLWNPAKEDQATDRVYRIGQTKTVYVYYLISVDPEESFVSFDQRLDELLTKKRSLATDFLYPSELIEVKPDEFLDILDFKMGSEFRQLSIEDIDRMKPVLFEALVAALYDLLGYKTYLTPIQGDYGVDVVCLPRNNLERGLVIQCKHTTKESAGIDGVSEVSSAVNMYEGKFLTKFDPAVITNGNFSRAAEEKARSNRVKLINRSELLKMMEQVTLTYDRIYAKEDKRLKNI